MFRRVLWPLALPGILAGTILTFILAMNAYATPFLLGGPLFKMMAPLIYNEFTQKTNWPFGGAIAFILMTVTLQPDRRRQPDHPAPQRDTPGASDMTDETRSAPLRRPDRRRQHLAAHRRRPVRGDRQVRRGERAPHLRRLLEPAPEVVGRHPAEIRDRSLPAVRLHDRQERLRHRPGDRRHGPAAQRPVRRLLPGLLRQRLHAAGVAAARGRRRRLRLRRPEDAGELPPGLPPLHLYREPAARGRGGRRPAKAPPRSRSSRPAPRCRS